MRSLSDSNWGGGFLIGLIIGAFVGGLTISQSGDDIEAGYAQCEVVREDYSAELERAWDNISFANDQLSEAQSYAWSSYEEMGEVLDSLEEVDFPDDPNTICF